MKSCSRLLTLIFFSTFFFVFVGCSFQAPEDKVREYSRNEPGFVILKATTQFARVHAEDSANWQARAEIKMQVCLGRTFAWRQLEPGVQFELELADSISGDGKAKVYTTMPDGCIDFSPSVPFAFAEQKTRFLKKYLIVRGRHAELAGLARVRVIYLDPWNKTDVSDWNESANGYPVAAQSGPLQLRVQQLSFARLKSREIIVDDNLRLSFRYNYVLSYSNQYARLRELNAAPVSSSVWPGTRFSIQGIVVSPNEAGDGNSLPEDLSKYHRIAGFKTIASEDSNGQVSTEVSLQVDLADVPLLDGRPRLVLDIQPISNAAQIPEPARLALSFDPRVEQVVYVPQTSVVGANELLSAQSDLTLKAANHPAGVQLWTKTPSIKPSSAVSVGEKLGLSGPIQVWQASTLFVVPIPESVVDNAVRDPGAPTALLKHFDFLFEHMDTAFPGSVSANSRSRFLEAPELYASWARFTVADSVDRRPLDVKSGAEILGVTANVFKHTVTQNINGMGERIASGSETTDFRSVGFNAFGNGRTLNWIFQGRNEKYKMREVSVTKAAMEQSGLTRVTNFYADRLNVSLTGKFRDCLVITMATPERPNFLFCVPRSEPLRESYFFVTDQYQANSFSLTDSRNLQERQLANIFRGEREFAQFSGMLRNQRLALKIEPSSVADCNCTMDGISNIQVSAVPAVATERLRTLSAALAATFKDRPVLSPEGLFVYFNSAMTDPQRILGNPQGLAGFERFADLILSRGNKSRVVYFEILKLMHTNFKTRGMAQPEDILFQLAQRKSLP